MAFGFPSGGPCDLITMIQVAAHYCHPRSALEAAWGVTAPGGYWLIEMWKWRSMTARILGRHWHEYRPPSVLNWFSPHSLRILCDKLGMEFVASGRPKKRLAGERAKSLLKYNYGNGPLGRRMVQLADSIVPDRLSVPYPAEDLFWMLLQRAPTDESP